MRAGGELALQSEERCSGLPTSLSPAAGPDKNKGKECGPEAAGELAWVRLPECWSLGQGRMDSCQMPGQACHEKEASALSFYPVGLVHCP